METAAGRVLKHLAEQLTEVAEVFAAAGHELFFVGGIVRDALMGEATQGDVDLTTNARPAEIKMLLEPLATVTWNQGEKFGTIGGKVGGFDVEVTTYRGENYQENSRNPEVHFGDSLEEDLKRRDFSINAMAVSVETLELVDPFHGLEDLRSATLRTPFDPLVSFTDDPLRVLRAARFAARMNLAIDPALADAAAQSSSRLSVVATERIAGELLKLLATEDPTMGLQFLLEVGAWRKIFGWEWNQEQLKTLCGSLGELDASQRLVAALYFSPDHEQSLQRLSLSSSESRHARTVLRSIQLLRDRTADKPLLRSLLVSSSKGRKAGSAIESSMLSAIGVGLALNLSARRFSRARDLLSEMKSDNELDNLTPPISGTELITRFQLQEGPEVGRLLGLVQTQIIDKGPLPVSEVWQYLDDELNNN